MVPVAKPRVALVQCPDYEYDKVGTAVNDALAHLGGIGRFVTPGQKVFLKVNLLTARKIEDAVTTHPAVVKAVVKEVQAAGGVVTIGDSPGGPYSAKALNRAYRAAGLDVVAEETGAILNFDTSVVDLPHPEGKLLRTITVLKPVADADVVITIPKLKTHGLTRFTGAVKVLFGVIPGLIKAEYHLKMPAVQDFSDMLVDIATLIKPSLTIMDAIVGMEGEGPSAGKPKTVGLILASEDSFACDIVASSVVGIGPDEVTTTRAAVARDLTTGRLDDIEMVGAAFDSVKIAGFKGVEKGGDMMARMPKPLYPFIERYLRPKPVVRINQCTGCATCMSVCPPKAIAMVEKKPHTNYEKCIRCYCCQELCPESAVTIYRPWLSKKIFARKA
jgi:uncharacterized protein (DUF362 family)/Pyruvate/2-oxoacid:ferredoxin oxidoreductase delta subunit